MVFFNCNSQVESEQQNQGAMALKLNNVQKFMQAATSGGIQALYVLAYGTPTDTLTFAGTSVSYMLGSAILATVVGLAQGFLIRDIVVTNLKGSNPMVLLSVDAAISGGLFYGGVQLMNAGAVVQQGGIINVILQGSIAEVMGGLTFGVIILPALL